ncbi:STAS domain-containing protein [Streptomyces sp. TRM 70351]|uniref:STAS domain-containing protein n=1 Tax=Streptomyces sp. TRM 70351 TaxID=3116552 RepID=UPI002E7B5AEF|nr:STAS domain-containing protein [Streptomyces sp. TRM 70351]MEE1927089.1 STAS domain-containing protein [Streptomyces sp. TRM 70351]
MHGSGPDSASGGQAAPAPSPPAPRLGDLDGHRVVTVSGDLDMDTAAAVRETLAGVVDSGGTRLIVDLSPLAFCDSSGLRALLTAHRKAAGAGGVLCLAAVPPQLERLLEITGLLTEFSCHPDAAAAAAFLTATR